MDNFTQIDQALDTWVDEHAEELIRDTQGLLRIPSVEGPAVPGAPFGVETRHALDFALTVAARYGLTTKQVDGYAGHIEWIGPDVSDSSSIVGVLAHLDVVPVGDESQWKSPPFAAEIHEGMLIARGAIDDKGPAMASLYALLAVAHCSVPATHRIRVILGLDEESGDGCVKHYFAHEEMPETGFTPDAEFPLIYAEKGIADVVVTKSVPHNDERLHIIELSGGERPNMVPDKAVAILGQTSGSWLAVNARLNAVIGIQTEIFEDGQKLRVIANGVSAHGSTPHAGVNAVAVLCDALLMLDHQEDQHELIAQIQRWAADTTGGTLGIAGADKIAGSLTSNLGILSYANGQAHLTFNIRYPVTWSKDTLRTRLESSANQAGFSIAEMTNTLPLYVPQDDLLVATLLSVYRAETGDMQAPMTIGGGTYARVMKHGVAFGAFFSGAAGGGAHQANESWAVADLIRATKIFAKAITRLACQ